MFGPQRASAEFGLGFGFSVRLLTAFAFCNLAGKDVG
jgi:hypothetical protein